MGRITAALLAAIFSLLLLGGCSGSQTAAGLPTGSLSYAHDAGSGGGGGAGGGGGGGY